MKTLGQIALNAFIEHKGTSDSSWEAAAQAVRDAVIEECAKVCEKVDCASCCADELRDLLKGKQ